MSQLNTKWLLWAVMFCTLPVPYFMLVVGGLLPQSAVLYLGVRDLGTFPLNCIYLAIYGGVFYVVGKYLAKLLFYLPSHMRHIATALILALAAGGSFLPLYGVGHSEYEPHNLYRLFQYGLL